MSLLLYSIGFWAFALVIILFKYTDFLQDRFTLRVIIKVIPGILAVIYVLMYRNSDVIFYFMYAIALVFCVLGDFGMEVNLLSGLGMFLFGHIIFIITFIWQSIIIGITAIPVVVFGIAFFIMLVYIVLFRRYLSTTEKDTPKPLLRAVDVYSLMISLTLCTSVFLWFTSSTILGYIPVLGAIMFVISDTMIGIREFHHDFKYQNYLVYSTYYIAIYLLSLVVLVYLF